MRDLALALLGALLWTVVRAAPAAAEPVRIFAVGHKQRLDDAISYQTFRDKMAALMDAAHPARASLVQAGTGDVASHLVAADPSAPARALVVFPEDAGLVAALIGSRGTLARTQTSAPGAIASLLGTYGPQFTYYAGKYPQNPLVRNLVLATTDTLYRSFYETFRDLAMTHGLYLAACANIPPARRVEEGSEAGLVALLRDPDEPGRPYAYEATSPYPYNTTLVFAPDGEVLVPGGAGGTRRSPSETGGVILGSTNKAYLTPIELPPPGNAGGLALATGAVRDLDVLDTPVGHLAIVISKDAWMVDVNDRFAAKGANVILQPEAFSDWAYAATPWQPDIFKEGGFANLQKTPQFIVNVNASMTGNFFDVTFDGQSAVIGRKRKRAAGTLSAGNAWIGQNPDTGFLALAPWIVPDPGIADAGLGLAARRARLAAEGAKLLPGSGVACGGSLVAGACENGYREAVVFADADVPTGPITAAVDPMRAAPPRFQPSVRVNPQEATPLAQHAPRVAARGARVYVVWHEEAGGLPGVVLAVSRNRGASFSPPVRVSDNAPGSVAELHPAIAVRKNRVFVTWQEFTSGRDDDSGRIMLARVDARGRKIGRAVRVDDHDGSGTWLPSVAVVKTDPIVAWIDERDPGPEGEPQEHVYAARGLRGGVAFTPAVRVDAGAPDVLALHNDNKWAPALAATGETVYAAWADFRNYNWDIFLARSDDGGASWGTNVRVDDFPDLERLNERPVIGLDRRGPVHVAWTDLRAREPDTNVFHARSDDRGASFAPSRQLDDSKVGFDPDTDTPTNQWHPALAVDGRRLFVAWQDNRLGNDDVFFTTSTDGGATFAPAERVDDTGAGTSEQARPQIAVTGQGRKRRCYVVWEDDRNGTSDVYLARRACGGR
jgi:predicted amidohydrolase